MQVKDIEITLISIDHKEGIGKASGKPYSFYVMIFADDDLNRLPAEIGKDLLVDGMIPDWLFKAAEAKRKVSADLRILPKGFDVKVVIDSIAETE